MKNILIIGAGRSACSLFSYLLRQADSFDWKLTVADVDVHLAEEKIAGHSRGTPLSFDIRNAEQRRSRDHRHRNVRGGTIHGCSRPGRRRLARHR
jgi:hypothetical protein